MPQPTNPSRIWGGEVVLKHRINIVQGDITRLSVDAIVNAANAQLAGGGGVDGAIHRAAGPELMKACRAIGGCPTGDIRVTPGFNLPCKFVFHAVGPIWQGGNHNEPELLQNCYHQALKVAAEKELSSIAFPAISCGVYGYPLNEATKIALTAVHEWLKTHSQPEQVTFVLFDGPLLEIYRQKAKALFSS